MDDHLDFVISHHPRLSDMVTGWRAPLFNMSHS